MPLHGSLTGLNLDLLVGEVSIVIKDFLEGLAHLLSCDLDQDRNSDMDEVLVVDFRVFSVVQF